MTSPKTPDPKTPSPKTTRAGAATRPKTEARSEDELRIACEIHTLCQLLKSELAMTNPWLASALPQVGYQQPTVWPPTPPEAFVPGWPAPARGAW